MRVNIDRDIRLFVPKHYKFLLFGGNFLFSKRLYEIVKRNHSIKRTDFINEVPDLEIIKGLLNYYNSDTLIITSEILLKIDDTGFYKLLDIIKNLSSTKFIFVSILKDLSISKYNIKSFSNRIKIVKDTLNCDKDLYYEFSSFITYVDSNIQENPLFNLNESFSPNNEVHLADDVIKDIIKSFNKLGKLTYNPKKTPSFDKIKNYALSQSKCSLNLIYRKNSNEIVKDNSVAYWRNNLGASLKSTIPTDIINSLDAIVPIPETGKYYAQGLASALDKPYIEAFYKRSEMGRSFDINNSAKRKQFITSKLGLIEDLVDSKTIGIVDEAIFTGSTLKVVSELLKHTQVNKVYFFIPSPPCISRCIYNLQPNRKMLCEDKSIDDLITYFNIDGIYFQSLDTFNNIITPAGFNPSCCFYEKNEYKRIYN